MVADSAAPSGSAHEFCFATVIHHVRQHVRPAPRIVTSEMAAQRLRPHGAPTTRTCHECLTEGHAPEARFCMHCAAPLPAYQDGRSLPP